MTVQDLSAIAPEPQGQFGQTMQAGAPKQRLADVLAGITEAGLERAEFNARFLALAGDLVNARLVAAIDGRGQLHCVGTSAGGLDELTLKTLFARLHRVTSASRLAPQDRSAVGGDGFAVPLSASRDNARADDALVMMIVVLGAATPVAIGLSGERLEMLATLHKVLAGGRRRGEPIDGAVQGESLEIIGSLFERRTAALRLKAFATRIAETYALEEVVVATVAGARAQRIAFSDIGSPNAASTVGAGVRKAINSALRLASRKRKPDAAGDEDNDGPAIIQRGPWLVAVGRDGGRSAVAFAVRGEPDDEFANDSLKTIAATYARFVAIAPGMGTAGGMASRMRAKLGDWRVSSLLVVCLAAAAAVPVADRVEAPIKLAAEQRRIVTAPYDAVLTKVNVKVDDEVRAGKTVLAELSSHEIDLKIRRSEANRVTQIAQRAIAQRDGNAAGVRRAELEAAKAAAESELLQYRKSLSQITSQIDGVIAVSDVEKRIGSVVARGETLFEVTSPKGIRVEMFVPDDRIGRLGEYRRGEFALAAEPDRHWTFDVERVHPSAETVGTRTVFRVEGRLTGPAADISQADTARLRAGMEGVGRVETGRAPFGWLLIRDAVNAIRAYFWI